MNDTSNNPGKISRNLLIAELRLQGLSMLEISKQVDVTHQQVSNILRSKDISGLINDGLKEQVLMLPLTNEIYWQALSNYKDDPKLAVDVSAKIQANIGIAGTRTDNPLVAQYLQINNINHVISPGIGEIMRYQRDKQQATDADFEEIED